LFHSTALEALAKGAALRELLVAPVRERIARAKYLAEDVASAEFDSIAGDIAVQLVSPDGHGTEGGLS